MYFDILTIITIVIVNIFKIIYSILAVLITLIYDYNENICKSFLENLNVNGTCENLNKYYEFKKNESNGLALFTHTSYLDGIILLKELKEPLSFVCLKDALIMKTYDLAKKWNCLIIEGKNNTEKITNNILNRKNNESLLFLAPSGAEGMNQKNENKLCEFKTGAFVSLSPILPILISYSPHIYCDNNTSKVKYLLSLLNRETLYYKVKILDPIYPLKNDTIISFKKRVYKIMNIEKNKIEVDTNIEPKKDNKILISIIILCLIISYLLFSKTIKENILIILILTFCIIFYCKNKHYIYKYIYKNIVYIYGVGLSIYSLFNKNYLLFINSIIYPCIYKIFNKKFIGNI